MKTKLMSRYLVIPVLTCEIMPLSCGRPTQQQGILVGVANPIEGTQGIPRGFIEGLDWGTTLAPETRPIYLTVKFDTKATKQSLGVNLNKSRAADLDHPSDILLQADQIIR